MTQTYVPNNKYEILTPTGWADFEGVFVNENVNKESVTITTTISTITSTTDHRFFTDGQEVRAVDLSVGDYIDTTQGPVEIITISEGILADTYDIFNAEGHVVIVNENHSHQCDELAFVRPSVAKEFWTAITPTLSTGGKSIITSTPNSDEDQYALLWKGANKTEDAFGNTTDVGINGYKAFSATWDEHPDRDQSWADEMRAKLGDDKFRREILCFAGDTIVQVKDINNTKSSMTIEELYAINHTGFKIRTDSGWHDFDGVIQKGEQETLTLTLEYTTITLTSDHKVYLESLQAVKAVDLVPGHMIKTSSGPQKLLSVKVNKSVRPVYDIINTGPDRRFYANNILCSNCEFLIADETLINPNTLIDLEGVEPVSRMGQVRWYQRPKKGMLYTVALDPSLGTGNDPAAIQIFEANTTTQIGEWKHNKTDIPSQIRLLAKICEYIVDITEEPEHLFYSLENNTIGEAALLSLREYGEHNIPGTFLCERGKKRKGFCTTPKTKLATCAKFKSLLESKKMTLKSRSLISELKSFVANGASYAAKSGEHDDLVMAVLLSVRMHQSMSNYFGDLSEQLSDHDDFIAPMPFFVVFG